MSEYLIEEPFALGNRPANRAFHKGKGKRCIVLDGKDCQDLHRLLYAVYVDASEGELEDYTYGICQYLYEMARSLYGPHRANKIFVSGFLWLAQKWPDFSGQIAYPIGRATNYHRQPYKFRGDELRARLSCLEYCINLLADLLGEGFDGIAEQELSE